MMMSAQLLNAILGFLSVPKQPPASWSGVVASILDRYTETVHLFLLTPDGRINNFLIQSSGIPVILNASSSDLQNEAGLHLALCNSVSPVIALLREGRVSFDRGMPWVVAFVEPTNEPLNQMFETFFNHGVLDVISVHPEDAAVYIYSYFPFTLNYCYRFDPVLMTKAVTGPISRQIDLFPKHKVENFYNCPVEVLLFPFLPHILYPETDGPTFSRNMAELTRIVFLRLMKFRPVYIYAANHTEGVQLLSKSPLMLSAGVTAIETQVSHGHAMYFACVTWCLPTSTNSDHRVRLLLECFNDEIWTALVITVFAVVIFARFLFKRSRVHTSSWMFVLSVVLENPFSIHYRQHKVRFFVISLHMTFLVIGTIFKARLHSLVATMPGPSKFVNAEEVYDSNLNLYLSPRFRPALADSMGNTTISPSRFYDYDRTKPDSFKKVVDALRSGRGGLCSTTEACRRIASQLGKTSDGYYKVYTLSYCLSTVPVTFFAYAKESPFAKRVRAVTAMLREFGLTQRLLTSPFPKEVHSTAPMPTSVKDVLVIMHLWIAGLLLSVVVFVGELLAKYFAVSIRLRSERKNAWG